MTYSFILAHPQKEMSAILVVLRDGTKRKTISTGITINTNSWDKKNKTIIKKSDDKVYIANIANIENNVGRILRETEAEDATLDKFYTRVCEEVMGRKEENKAEYFLPFYLYWATTSFENHTAYRATLLSYRIMDSFVDNKKIKFDEINYNFYISFLGWLRDVRGYKINTQGTQIKNLKAVMNEAYKRKLHDNRDYLNFTKPTEIVDSVYLSMEEYDKLYNLNLSGIKAKARDLFLIGCYTALRVSDYSRLTINDVRNGYIYIEQKKTKGKIVIPAHKRVIEILNRYNGAPAISEQKLNMHIKEICKLAGVTELIGIKENGIYIYKEKCELVSSHTARRSAATNMALIGTPLRDIMQITGHKTESSLLRYIKISNEQNAQRLAKNPFFL